jgi:hypothetical protein
MELGRDTLSSLAVTSQCIASTDLEWSTILCHSNLLSSHPLSLIMDTGVKLDKCKGDMTLYTCNLATRQTRLSSHIFRIPKLFVFVLYTIQCTCTNCYWYKDRRKIVIIYKSNKLAI